MHPDLLRKQYDFELEQRNGLTSATNIPIVAITVVASATSVILTDFRYQGGLLSYIFFGFAVATVAAISFSVYSVFRSFWNYNYKKLPLAKDLRLHGEALQKWHLQNGSTHEESRALAEVDFSDYLNERIAEAADWNGKNNVVRGNYLHRATAAIAFGVALLLPAALLYAHNRWTAEDKVYQVRVLGSGHSQPQEQSMSSGSKSSTPNQPASAPAPAPSPTPAPKPAGPPNLEFKGNQDLTKPGTGPTITRK
jgi:hypothetical protein